MPFKCDLQRYISGGGGGSFGGAGGLPEFGGEKGGSSQVGFRVYLNPKPYTI